MKKKIRLTIETIEKEEPTKKERFIWDDRLAGFGLRVMPTGVKSFIIQYRNASSNSRRLTLGKFGVLTPDEARRLAKEKLAEVTKGTVSTLGGMMTYAIHEGIITHSPTRGVKKPKGKCRKIRLT